MRSHLAFLTIVLLAAQSCGTPDSMVPTATASEQPAATATVKAAGVAVLPAPLYFLSEDEQIWRMEADATTLTKITAEPEAVVEFDVSALDGSLVYITANSLVRTDAMGSGRTVLVEGSAPPVTPDAQWYGAAFSDPIWSPDGQQIAYGSNGVNLYSLDSSTSKIVLASDPYPADGSMSPVLVRLYRPAEWSPDGTRLLIQVGYYPEGGTLGVLNLSDGSHIEITNPNGFVCCYQAWGRDGLNVYYANDSIGMYDSGLWRADVIGGMSVTLIASEENGAYSLVGYPYQAADGQLYTFMTIVTEFPVGYVPLSMTRSAPDGVTGRATLRTDSHILADVLWDPAGLGAVIGDMSAQIMEMGYPAQASNPLLWLPADNSPAVTLPAMGSMPRWGK